jgi:hypothetical protein
VIGTFVIHARNRPCNGHITDPIDRTLSFAQVMHNVRFHRYGTQRSRDVFPTLFAPFIGILSGKHPFNTKKNIPVAAAVTLQTVAILFAKFLRVGTMRIRVGSPETPYPLKYADTYIQMSRHTLSNLSSLLRLHDLTRSSQTTIILS